MSRERACGPYVLVLHRDGVELRETVTGYAVKRDGFKSAMAELHRQLIARRDALRERIDLSDEEREELDALAAKFSDRFLRLGLAA